MRDESPGSISWLLARSPSHFLKSRYGRLGNSQVLNQLTVKHEDPRGVAQVLARKKARKLWEWVSKRHPRHSLLVDGELITEMSSAVIKRQSRSNEAQVHVHVVKLLPGIGARSCACLGLR